jgi:predicted DsbA family dithiol-disulfide isomerase
MPQPLRIDFVSDVACPWCVIGLRSLLTALEAMRGEIEAELRFWPFELNPDIAPEGENVTEHVQKKYGSSAERSAAVRQAIKDNGAALGFTFNYGPDSRIWNTFDAHRLLHWAALEGRQLELKQALFKSNFTEQRPTNDPDALADAVAEAGLDPARTRQILGSDEFAEEVRAAEEHARRNGIGAVPTLIFNERWLIQGAQAPEVFERAIRDIVSGKARES